ncbi:Elongation factor Tu GTP binding domain containing protein [Novymonas esmeraldas]|uniref:Elongation factor Tu GTP binding domain containing protein n=1 Tax=Novymonas esmeraldas TaxID=1808958 RepID=A0AAW0F6A4_9TRYP
MLRRELARRHHRAGDDTASSLQTCDQDGAACSSDSTTPCASASFATPMSAAYTESPPLSANSQPCKHGVGDASVAVHRGDVAQHSCDTAHATVCRSSSPQQRHVLAERASASFHHDRRLQRGQIAPRPGTASPSAGSCPTPPVSDSPPWAALPVAVVGREEVLAERHRLCPASAPPTRPAAALFSLSGGVAAAAAAAAAKSPCAAGEVGAPCRPLIAEDDEGDVEYKWRLTGISHTRFEHLVTQMQFRVSEGRGQCLYELGVSDDGTPRGLTWSDFNESVQTIQRMAAQLQFDATLLQCCVVPRGTVSAASGCDTVEEDGLLCGEIMVSRRHAGNGGHDLSVAFCGAIGSGKSTLMAVLLTSRLDNGCGGTRQSLFNHKHELDTGRTSSLASRVWTVMQEPSGASPTRTLPGSAMHTPSLRGMSVSPIASGEVFPALTAAPPTPPFTCASPRSITLLDAGGDITKSMLFGLMSRKPDYVCVCVAADVGDVSDVALYAEVCCAMNTPFIVAVTKSDRVEEFELDGVVMELAVALESTGCVSEQVDSMLMAAAYCRDWLPRHRDAAVDGGAATTTPPVSPIVVPAGLPRRAERLRVPVFCVSSVRGGESFELFRSFLSHLPTPPPSPPLSPSSWGARPPFEVLLDCAFTVDGVGHVVRGRVARGPVEVGCSCCIGPGSDGRFYAVLVRGIHVDGEHVNKAQVGDEATFALDRLPDAVTVSHKGKVLVRQPETVARTFQATVAVLSQSMSAHMEPIMYTRNARQAVHVEVATQRGSEEDSSSAAAAVAGHRESAMVQCRFLFRPEVVSVGDAVVLHWPPRGVAVGRITSVAAPATP